MKSSNPAGWYREIRVMTKGSKSTPSIIQPSGIDPANTQQVADSINHHFTSIAKDIPVLDMNNLPAYLPAPESCPSLQEWDVFNQLRRINSRKAGGPDGIPARIIQEFACELSKPMTDILNSSYQQGTVPSQWKQAIVVPLPKTKKPIWNQLRPVSLTGS